MPRAKDPNLVSRLDVWKPEGPSPRTEFLMSASGIAETCRGFLMPEGIAPETAEEMRSLLNEMSALASANYDPDEQFTDADFLACFGYALERTTPRLKGSTQWRRQLFVARILPVLLRGYPGAYTHVKTLYDKKMAQHVEERPPLHGTSYIR